MFHRSAKKSAFSGSYLGFLISENKFCYVHMLTLPFSAMYTCCPCPLVLCTYTVLNLFLKNDFFVVNCENVRMYVLGWVNSSLGQGVALPHAPPRF